MKKTNIRVHRNGGSKSVSPQVPNKPEATSPETTRTSTAQWWRDDKLQLLILGNAQAEENVWASRDGLLYLWDGDLAREPRALSLEAARAWWEEFHDPKLEFASPYFKEGTAAARLVSVVCQKHHGSQAEVTAPNLPRLIDELESSIDQTEALFILMQREIMNPDGGYWNKDIENGFFELHHQTAIRLRAANRQLQNAYKTGAR